MNKLQRPLYDTPARVLLGLFQDLKRQGCGDHQEFELLLAALNDRRPRVSRAARQTLARSYVVPRDRLWKLLAATPYAHTRSQCAALLSQSDRTRRGVRNAATLKPQALRHTSAQRYTMLSGRVVLRTYELPPRWRVPWKWLLDR